MPTLPSPSLSTRKRLATGLTLLVVTGIGGTALVAGGANAATPAPSATAAAHHHHVKLTAAQKATAKADRAKFEAARASARALTGTARTTALKALRADVKAGKFGPVLKNRFDHPRKGAGGIWGHKSKQLRADLKAAGKDAAKDHAVYLKALDGTYGPAAKKHAETLRRFVDGK